MGQHLWAPWRIKYVTSASKLKGCFLCHHWKRQAEDAANLVVARAEDCFAILNRYPYNGGHLLIAPRQHASRLGAIPEETFVGMMRLARVAERVLTRELHPDGFNVGLNLGRPAGAGVAGHLHLHIVPRWNGDTNFMPVMDDTRVVPVALSELQAQLAPRFAKELG